MRDEQTNIAQKTQARMLRVLEDVAATRLLAIQAMQFKQLYFIVVTLLLLLTAIPLRSFVWFGSLDLHTNMELIATLLAVVISCIALVHFYSDKTYMYLFIGVGFLGTALLDGFHAIVTADIFVHLFPARLFVLITWSWLASRFFISFYLARSYYRWLKNKNSLLVLQGNQKWAFYMSAILICFCVTCLLAVKLPPPYISEPIFINPMELIPMALFLFAFIGYYIKGNWRTEDFEYWLMLFLLFSIMTQFYMCFAMHVLDPYFNFAHLLKICSYGLLFVGLVRSVYARFARAIVNTHQLHRYAEKLEQSNQDLCQFASVASHDLKAPLRKIITFAGFLQNEDGHHLSEEGRDYLGRMSKSATRMSMLIDGLLDYSRISNSNSEITQVNIRWLLQEVISDLEVLIQEAGADIQLPEFFPNIQGNATQLRQLWQNLLLNAVKFRHQKRSPVIVISCRECNGELSSLTKFYEFCVADNGIGFDDTKADKIFSMFSRLHRDSEYSGAGIGLSVCKRIVEKHGGEIKVKSQINVGTTFTLMLPEKQLIG